MDDEDHVVESLWARRVRWARAADAAKKRVDYARSAVLYLGGVGAIAAAMTATVARASGLPQLLAATVSATCLAAATFVGAHFLTPAEFRRWSRTRAVAESIKQVIYRFRARAGPFRGNDALLRLYRAVAEIEESADDLLPFVAEVDADAASAGRISRSATAMPPVMTPDDYVRDRVQHQITHYYDRTAREYAGRARRLRMWTIVLGLTATVVAALAAVQAGTATGSAPISPASTLAPWVAVLTTLGAAVAGHLTGRRYEFLVMSYSATARRLQQLLDEWKAAGSPADEPRWTAFVDDCENAIAVENQTWVAKWAEPPLDDR
ncbi:DUF4231 domain-containing protein [Nocardia higoensis]|uniref:DUF4231 domain-containing protein n=1 Tax=Nocardia higoensis TaxID=228599 RepID=A0ABS0DGY3_9NOCA|nr:DUF4231 domain-containing protein [Nocardia higoensis]MBF6357732.1 DUF4231 domain-containing protein [Nocardia higoensis]